MAVSRAKKDMFVNHALERITMSAANTLTYQQLNFGVGQFQGVALVIHRIEYWISYATLQGLQATTDLIQIALTQSSNLGDLNMTHPEIIDEVLASGQGASLEPHYVPGSNFTKDFTNLPGGGLLVAANPIFIGMTTAGMGAAGSADVKIYFTFKELADKDYIELIQSRIQANI